MAKRPALPVIGVLALAALAGTVWFVYMFNFADGTIYASGYSEVRFLEIKPGMSRAKVEQRLGKPLNVYRIGDSPVWDYTDWDPDRGEKYKTREVQFDSHGSVIGTISESHDHSGC